MFLYTAITPKTKQKTMKRLNLFGPTLAIILFASDYSFAATNVTTTNVFSSVRLDLFWAALPGMATCTVQGNEKKLSCVFKGHRAETNEIVPTSEAWAKFWKSMEEVKIWEWHRRYDRREIMDGLVWSLTIQRGDRKVSSGGSNGYPSSGKATADGWGRSALFMEYQKAVEDLIGRPIWKE